LASHRVIVKEAVPVNELQQIQEIARASLMPDFFGVRIDEEQLYGALRQVIAKTRLSTPSRRFTRLQQIAATSTTASALIEVLKKENLWSMLRDFLSALR
jgi:hypothetical protein